MRAVSARFLAAVTESHTPIVVVQALDYRGVTDPVLQAPDVVVVDGATGGTVTLDQTAASRGRLDVSITNLELLPTTADALLAPYGNELKVSRGVLYPDGVSELAALGVFRIDEVDIDDSATAPGAMRITGLDRSAIIIDARFEEPFQVDAGTNLVTALERVLAAGYPGIVTDFPTTTLTSGLLIGEEGGDRWAFAQDIATSLGKRLYFDGDGVAVLRDVSIGTTVVATLAEGEHGVLVSANRGAKRAGAYNRVIATGENTGEAAPVRGVATDADPGSPTFYGGPYGRVPMFYSSPFLTTDDQCASAAQSMLSKQLGTTQSVSLGAIVNPALEPDDTVRIVRALTSIDEAHILDSLTIPLDVGGAGATMSGATRATVGVLGA